MKAPVSCTACAIPVLLLVLSCGPDAGVINPTPRLNAAAASSPSERYSEWSTPVNLGPSVNSAFNESAPEISKDGLSLYFASNRPGGFGANDIYVSRRASVDDPWGPPVNLGPMINTAAGDAGPHLSRDGHLLYFTSGGRPGDFGGNDIYASYRANTDDDLGWGAPVNLGSPPNSDQSDLGPSVRRPELYFWRGPPLPLPVPGDIYVSRMRGDEFEEATLVEELSVRGAVHDEKPSIRFDGREIFLASNRTGSLGNVDLWVSTRQGNGQSWTVPVNLGPTINTTFNDRRPTLSPDGTMLFFDSDRVGGLGGSDLYVATRTKGPR